MSNQNWQDWEPQFVERLKVHYDEMQWLYKELYHDDQQAFDYFVGMLHEYYLARSPELKEWDDMRCLVPDWYKGNDMLGMIIYANCFAGNLKGVHEKLDYIKECGANFIHLMPLLESPKERSDGGYAVSNFRKVQPELGTMQDLYDLSVDCHSKGMNICLDFVMNHTSEDHEWAKRARAGEKEYQDRYYFFDDWTIPNEYEKTVPQVFPTTAPGNFTWVPEVGKPVMTMFYPYQWDLNYKNPVVFNDMTADMLYLCNNGVDIVRLDATPYIWKQLGTDNRNLPQVHTLVRIMRMATEIVCPGTLLLGEVVMEPSKLAPYFGTVDKPECHMLYNATTMCTTWNTVATRDVRLLRHTLDGVFALPKQFAFLNYLRCHDDIGWGLDFKYLKQFGIEEVPHKKYINDYLKGAYWGSNSRGELYNDDPRLGDARLCGTTASLCGIEAAEYENNEYKLDEAIRLDIMLHAFLLTQTGVPVIYSGDEVGQKNDYTYHDDPVKCEDSRYLHRGNFIWEDAAKRNDVTTRPGRLFTALQKLEAIRAEYGFFGIDADAWTLDTYNDKILCIGRYYEGEKLLGLFNFGDTDETAWINEEEDYIDLMTGEHRAAKAVGVPAHDFVWLYYNFNPKPAAVAETPKAKEAPSDAAAEPAVAEEAPAEATSGAVEAAETEPAKIEEEPKKTRRRGIKKAAEEEAAAEEAPKKTTRKRGAKKAAEEEAATAEEAPKKTTRKRGAKKAAEEEAAAAEEAPKKTRKRSLKKAVAEEAAAIEEALKKPRKRSSKKSADEN